MENDIAADNFHTRASNQDEDNRYAGETSEVISIRSAITEINCKNNPYEDIRRRDEAIEHSQLLRAIGWLLHTIAGLQQIIEIVHVHSGIRRGS